MERKHRYVVGMLKKKGGGVGEDGIKLGGIENNGTPAVKSVECRL